MIITHKLKPMDLAQKQNTGRVDVVQGDKYSRNIEFTFMYNGVEWQIPDGTTAIVRYKKPDATGGNYDTLPDGSTAYQINGNVLTVALAPQVCTVPGQVQLSVGLINRNAEINTFSVNIIVQPNPGAEYQSEDYIRLSGYVPNSGWSPNMYLGTDASGNVVAKEGAGAVSGAMPIARGESNDGIAYTATGDDLPTVQTGRHDTQTDPVGKGRQIVFIPSTKNANTAPTLQINGGEIIPIRQRAPQNQGIDDNSPDATLPVPAGALMRGVPYTLTFCGKHWLVDSQIATVPAPTATDAGKVLTVSEAGAAVWTAVANAEEVAV